MLDLTIPPDKFSIDGVPVTVRKRMFDGEDTPLPKITFTDPQLHVDSFERAASLEIFSFNGTTIFSPLAISSSSQLTIQHIPESSLSGPLLVLDLKAGVGYGQDELSSLLGEKGVWDKDNSRVSAEQYIVLFRTQLMDKVLQCVDQKGMPDYDCIAKTQKGRPGLTAEGAKFIAGLDIACVFMIDNISFESGDGADNGFPATHYLLGADEKMKTFTPLVYHVSGTSTKEFREYVNPLEQGKGIYVRLCVGNPPQEELPACPVSVKVYDLGKPGT